MELEAEGRRQVGRPKNIWSKVVEEDMRKLNITEDNSGGNSYTSDPSSGKLGTIKGDDNDNEMITTFT